MLDALGFFFFLKARGEIEFGSYLAFCPTKMGNLGGFAPLQLTSKAKFYRE